MKSIKGILLSLFVIIIVVLSGYSAIMTIYAKSLELLIAGLILGIVLGGYLLYKSQSVSFARYKKLATKKEIKEKISRPVWPYVVIIVFVISPIIRYMIKYGIMSEAFLSFIGLIAMLTILPLIIKLLIYKIRE